MLKRIKTEVSAELEITEILDRVVKKNGPALLFENVKGSSIPVFANAATTFDLVGTAQIGEKLRAAVNIDDIVCTHIPGGNR